MCKIYIKFKNLLTFFEIFHVMKKLSGVLKILGPKKPPVSAPSPLYMMP